MILRKIDEERKQVLISATTEKDWELLKEFIDTLDEKLGVVEE